MVGWWCQFRSCSIDGKGKGGNGVPLSGQRSRHPLDFNLVKYVHIPRKCMLAQKMTAEIPCLRDGEHLEQRSLLILYATETGTAQDTADHIARECRRVHFHCRVCSMETYAPVSDISLSALLTLMHNLAGGASIRVPRCLCRRHDGLRDGATHDDYSVEHASSIRFTRRSV